MSPHPDTPDTDRPRLLVVVGSTRPGRIGPTVADWFVDTANSHGGFDVEVADLHELNLPIFNEPNHPRQGQYEHEHTKQWAAIVDRADAYVFVTPEYNFGFNAAIKNAIDYLYAEWLHKGAGFVSYGGSSGGLRAVHMLQQVVSAFSMGTVPVSVCVPFVHKFLDDDGRLVADEYTTYTAGLMLDELLRWTTATKTLRCRRGA